MLLKENYQYQYPMELLSYHMEEFLPNKREDILFNLGGVLNHIIYFHSISDKKVEPEGILKKKILQSFDSLDNFKTKWKESALKLKGSGYTYLVSDKEGNLSIVNMLNQDSPYFHELIPLICIDLWEHAYYINYENKRDLYIDNFFDIMDFQFANKMYETNMKSRIKF